MGAHLASDGSEGSEAKEGGTDSFLPNLDLYKDHEIDCNTNKNKLTSKNINNNKIELLIF